ncbi:hypothetical protein LLB_0337 [Legionella longbeachae D-4968]|nr:hypothetical protein LLB_0337 [Legionella longbeachae D-4968]
MLLSRIIGLNNFFVKIDPKKQQKMNLKNFYMTLTAAKKTKIY